MRNSIKVESILADPYNTVSDYGAQRQGAPESLKACVSVPYNHPYGRDDNQDVVPGRAAEMLRTSDLTYAGAPPKEEVLLGQLMPRVVR